MTKQKTLLGIFYINSDLKWTQIDKRSTETFYKLDWDVLDTFVVESFQITKQKVDLLSSHYTDGIRKTLSLSFTFRELLKLWYNRENGHKLKKPKLLGIYSQF